MTSPSTLIRKARLAESRGHRSAGKRLRAEAAKLRRAARKKVKKPAAKKKAKKPNKILAGLQQAVERSISDRLSNALQEKHPLDQAVDRVLGPKATLEQRVGMRRELVEARTMGENNAAARHAGRVEALTEAQRICTVSGLIAIVEHSERLNGNLPPTMVLSGYMVARVVDALRKAGYTRDGLNGSGTTREAIGARVSAERQQWRVASDMEVDANRPTRG